MTPHEEPPVDETDNGNAHWHVTRGIPVAFIVSMLIYAVAQAATAAWFASAMAYRVEAIERAQVQTAPQGERLTRVEEKLVAVQTGIADIKSILQQPGKPGR
jgi:hypothetical protein